MGYNASLKHKQLLVGITGGIAAYKAADLVRRLRDACASVRVVMTQHAKEFISPLTLQAVSGYPVHDDLFDLHAEAAMGHIELARWADAIIIAPASADIIARLAHGHANDLLTTLCLASHAPQFIVPAMNQMMWKNKATEQNVQVLQRLEKKILGPAAGAQVCGDTGYGRMLEPQEIVEELARFFAPKLLAGKKVLLTAGPTQEAIDPVRYLSNHSSGQMGYALAEAARDAGADVCLISGPVALSAPAGIKIISVISAEDMLQQVLAQVAEYDIFISVAAVCDFRLVQTALQKIPKADHPTHLALVANPDIVATVARLASRPYVVGFAAETHDVVQHAWAKLQAKKLDMIVANQVGDQLGIGTMDNTVTVLWDKEQCLFPTMPKVQLARELITLIAKAYLAKTKPALTEESHL